MIWATRRLQQDEVRSIDALFRDQTTSIVSGGQMLLVAVEERPMIRLWVALPVWDGLRFLKHFSSLG